VAIPLIRKNINIIVGADPGIEDKGATLSEAGCLGAVLRPLVGRGPAPGFGDFKGLKICLPRSHFYYISCHYKSLVQRYMLHLNFIKHMSCYTKTL
jgi:hypothetical protein